MEPPSPSSPQNDAAAELFSKGVGNLLMLCEEVKRSIGALELVTLEDVLQWPHDIQDLLGSLDVLSRHVLDTVGADPVTTDLFDHCKRKVMLTSQYILKRSFDMKEPNQNNADDETLGNFQGVPVDVLRRDGQGAIARIVELNVILHIVYPPPPVVVEEGHPNVLESLDAVIQSYVQYQRQVIRFRARPAIAALVQIRRNGLTSVLPPSAKVVQEHDDDDNTSADDADEAPVIDHYHSPVLTTILGEAAALMHPLQVWEHGIRSSSNSNSSNGHHPLGPVEQSIGKLCQESIRTIDTQAQTLVKSVTDWFCEDRTIDSWIQKSSSDEALQSTAELAVLDGIVEEMAFGCQVLSRYLALVGSGSSVEDPLNTTNNNNKTIIQQTLPEWTWKYAALERFLAMQQWQTALAVASPVQIVLETEIYVPSVVEDAHYLSTRALERAASTRSLQAVGTVAHAVSNDVWSASPTIEPHNDNRDSHEAGIHRALIEGTGCWMVQEEIPSSKPHTTGSTASSSTATSPAPKSGFANALLDALDDDLSQKPVSGAVNGANHALLNARNRNRIPSAPTSGGFLNAIVGGSNYTSHQNRIRMNSDLCILNGTHAAATACRSLVVFLDALLSRDGGRGDSDENDNGQDEQQPAIEDDPKAAAMVQLAREDLFRYAETYRQLLTVRIETTMERWCGGTMYIPKSDDEAGRSGNNHTLLLCLDQMRTFFVHENYKILDAASLDEAEKEERLEQLLIGPLAKSEFMKSISNRCDVGVRKQMESRIAAEISRIILESILGSNQQQEKQEQPHHRQQQQHQERNAKEFSDLGALLLSKQVRLLQQFAASVVLGGTDLALDFQLFERLSQVLTVLQLEKPADWQIYQESSVLSLDELSKTMNLRVDFSRDAIKACLASIEPTRTAKKKDAS